MILFIEKRARFDFKDWKQWKLIFLEIRVGKFLFNFAHWQKSAIFLFCLSSFTSKLINKKMIILAKVEFQCSINPSEIHFTSLFINVNQAYVCAFFEIYIQHNAHFNLYTANKQMRYSTLLKHAYKTQSSRLIWHKGTNNPGTQNCCVIFTEPPRLL